MKIKNRLLSVVLCLTFAIITAANPFIGCMDTPDKNPDGNEIEDTASDTEIFTKKQSVLLLGQSNMAGRGDVNDVEPITDPKITVMRNGQWVLMQEPIHDDKPDIAGVGLGASFAAAFVEMFDCEIGLIPGAFGGTSLEDWAVGGQYYNRALEMAQAAQKDSDICAILWHQGEGDMGNEQYAEQLKMILNCFMRDLGLNKADVVVITGELGEYLSGTETVNSALYELENDYPNYAVASSAGLTPKSDNLHFDAASLRVFGYRYFAHFYELVTGKTFDFDDDPSSYLIDIEEEEV